MGDFGRSESAFVEGYLPCRQVSSGIFQRVFGSGTSEVVRHAFSDVHIVLPLFSIWLFSAAFFFFKGEEEKVVSDNRCWCSIKKLVENTYLW